MKNNFEWHYLQNNKHVDWNWNGQMKLVNELIQKFFLLQFENQNFYLGFFILPQLLFIVNKISIALHALYCNNTGFNIS